MSEMVSKPYTSSWVNRFTGWVGRLPGPSWSYFLGLGLVLLIIPTIIFWIEGTIPQGTFSPALGYLTGAIAYILILLDYLDEQAAKALTSLRPILKTSEEEYQEIQYRLTTLPGGMTILASIIAILVVFLTELPSGPYSLDLPNISPISANLFRLVYLICWWFFGVLLYHTIHQLRMINLIFNRHTRVDLFQMNPLYAFSNLSAITAGSLTVLPYGFMLVNYSPSDILNDPITATLIIAILSLALITFIWPQLGIHRLQTAEKNRLLEEANRRFEAVISDLHRRVDAGEFDEIGELNVTLNTLELEKAALNKISTWPWQPETIRWLATALVLPLGLWVIQVILQRFLTP